MVSPAPIFTKPTIFQRHFMKMSCWISPYRSKGMESARWNSFTFSMQYDCQWADFLKLPPAVQLFVNKFHAEFHENMNNGFVADITSQTHGRKASRVCI